MTQPYLIGQTVNNFTNAVTLFPNTSTNPVSFWTPTLPSGYYYTGMRAVGSVNLIQTSEYMSLTPQVVVKSSDGNTGAGYLLCAPSSYTLVWSATSFYMWQPIAPNGYIALGMVVTSTNSAPSLPGLMCVRQDLCASVALNPNNLIWNNAFVSPQVPPMWLSTWNLPNATSSVTVSSGVTNGFPPGYTGSTGPYYTPPSVVVWDLKQPVF